MLLKMLLDDYKNMVQIDTHIWGWEERTKYKKWFSMSLQMTTFLDVSIPVTTLFTCFDLRFFCPNYFYFKKLIHSAIYLHFQSQSNFDTYHVWVFVRRVHTITTHSWVPSSNFKSIFMIWSPFTKAQQLLELSEAASKASSKKHFYWYGNYFW